MKNRLNEIISSIGKNEKAGENMRNKATSMEKKEEKSRIDKSANATTIRFRNTETGHTNFGSSFNPTSEFALPKIKTVNGSRGGPGSLSNSYRKNK